MVGLVTLKSFSNLYDFLNFSFPALIAPLTTYSAGGDAVVAFFFCFAEKVHDWQKCAFG